MKVLDFEDRWIYKGSYTEPPCTGGVYWNVLRNVYPIGNNKLESIKEKLVKLAAEADPDNYKYDPAIFTKWADEDEKVRTKSPNLKFYRKL